MSLPLLGPWVSALVYASLTGSIILLSAFALLRLMHRSSAASRHAVLAVTLGAFLVFPAVQLVAPRWTVAMLPPAPAELSGFIETDRAPFPIVHRPAPVAGSPSSDATAPAGDGDVGTAAAATASPGTRGADATAPITWRDLLLALWLVGAALIVLRLLAGIAGVWLLARRSTMVTDGGWLATAHALAQRLGLARGVTLLRGDRGSVPLTWGVLQPVVWLPPGAEGWDADRRTVVLAHELAHVKRRDAMTQWIANIAVALHWFNPLVWVAVRRLRTERERACDDAVIALGTQPTVYAEHLLELVRSASERSGPMPAMAMARRSQFEGRLLAILDGASQRAGVGSMRLVLMIVFAALLTLPLAAMRPIARADVSAAELPGIASEAGGYPLALRPESEQPQQRVALSMPRLAPPTAESRAVVDSLVAYPAAAERMLNIAASSGDSALLLDLIAGAAEIGSSVERARILVRIARLPGLEPRVASALVGATTGMSSDVERTRVLTAVLEHQPSALDSVAPAVVAAVSSMHSSVERANVLESLFGRAPLATPVIEQALKVASSIPSTVHRMRVLRMAIERQPAALDGASPVLFWIVDEVASSVERSKILVRILERTDASEAVVARALESASAIPSSTERLRVMSAAARGRSLEAGARAAYLRAVSTLGSSADRQNALSVLIPGEPKSGANVPSRARNERSVSRGAYIFTDTVGGVKRDVRLTWNDVTIDSGELVNLLPGGALVAEETRTPIGGRAVKRRLVVNVDGEGQPVYDYCINDDVRPLDSAGRAWFRALLLEQERAKQ